MLRHVLPNVLGPVMVLATIQVATAIITEATLSFLGVGSAAHIALLGNPHSDWQRLFIFG
jgi:ABC-type dipeptide/oligopeptide/nickel transport system permease subunit